jgi:anti-sigma28 factor (negative regulator of flagellin synthesis)
VKIDNFTPSTDLQSTHVDKAQQAEHGKTQRANRPTGGKDSAAISPLTQQISQVLQQDSPDRVEAVAQAQKIYQSGNFSAPTAEVADALIQSAVDETILLSQVPSPSRES